MDPFKVKSLAESIILTAHQLENFANRHIFNPQGLTLSLAKIMHVVSVKKELRPIDILKMLGGTKSNITQAQCAREKRLYYEAFPACKRG